jgi:DNA-binding transcriptional LysR family regulator
MIVTDHGRGLLEHTTRIIGQLDKLHKESSQFCPRAESAMFHIAVSPSLPPGIIPLLLARMRDEASNSKIKISFLANTNVTKMLLDGHLDLVIADWEQPPIHLYRSILFEDELAVFIGSKNVHVLRQDEHELPLATYLKLPHIAPYPAPYGQKQYIDRYLSQIGHYRNIVAKMDSVDTLSYVLEQSDLVYTAGSKTLTCHLHTTKIRRVPLQGHFPLVCFYQIWHARSHDAPRHKWLRELVGTVCQDLYKEKTLAIR